MGGGQCLQNLQRVVGTSIVDKKEMYSRRARAIGAEFLDVQPKCFVITRHDDARRGTN